MLLSHGLDASSIWQDEDVERSNLSLQLSAVSLQPFSSGAVPCALACPHTFAIKGRTCGQNYIDRGYPLHVAAAPALSRGGGPMQRKKTALEPHEGCMMRRG